MVWPWGMSVGCAAHSSHAPESSTAAPTHEEVVFEKQAGGVIVSGTATTAGATTTIQFTINDDAGLAVVPLQPPTVSASLPDQQLGPFVAEVSTLDPATYQAVLDTPFPGRWEIIIGARVSQFEKPSVLIELTVPQ